MNHDFQQLSLTINGKACTLSVKPNETLVNVLRHKALLTGTKIGCDMGTCGCCTVIIDGRLQLSCLKLALECQGTKVETVEGLNFGQEAHPLQRAFAQCGGSQCGYCTPGFVMSAKALLDKNPQPDLEEVKVALSGNLCRCTGFIKIYDSVLQAAKELRGHSPAREPEKVGR